MTHVDPKTEGATPAAGSYAAKTRAWIQANLTDELRTDRCLDPGATLQQKIDFEAAQHIGGLTGIMWPKDYGGHGLTVREHLEANREIGLSPMPNAVNSIGKELAGPIIMAVGREDQVPLIGGHNPRGGIGDHPADWYFCLVRMSGSVGHHGDRTASVCDDRTVTAVSPNHRLVDQAG